MSTLFLVCPPGLEPLLAEEAAELECREIVPKAGGVEVAGDLGEAARLTLWCRGAVRILLRFASFRAMHLAQLDKRARKVDWSAVLSPDMAVRVEVTCRRSKIYHDRAARQRIEQAITAFGARIEAEAAVTIKGRIEDDLVTLSVDTSGESLHKRGHKSFVGKAPLRETLAALFLRAMDFDPALPLVDPMCGSGTFVLEAAEIAAGLAPGRDRDFPLEGMAAERPATVAVEGQPRFFGFDRDAGAIRGASDNADRAGVAPLCQFERQAVSDLRPPEGPPGLVMVNPPYGARIGNRKLLFGLYAALGATLTEHFAGWRVGLVTSDGGLARATALPFTDPLGPIPHGGLKVTLHRTGVLGG